MASLSSSDCKTQERKKIIPVHKSFLFRTITVDAVQTILTHNILDKDALNIEELRKAVSLLVDRYPILTGHLMYGSKRTTGGPGIFVETGHFDCFVNLIPAPQDMPSPAEYGNIHNADEMMNYVQDYIEPVAPPSRKGTVEIAKKLPVFGIDVMELPNGYMYYAPRLSHVIGDGRTYFMLIEELDAILNSRELPPPIVWGSDIALEFDFTHQKANPLFWLTVILGLLIHVFLGFAPIQNITLSKKKIEAKKKELMEKSKREGNASSSTYLSTNDIVTAALCESVSNQYKSFNQTADYRFGRCPRIGDRHGGNFTRLVPLQSSIGKDPLQVRKYVNSLGTKSQSHLDLPMWDTISGKFCNQTNWACIKRTLAGTVFHAPSQTVVREVDVPQVIIHQPNDSQLGIMHKLRNVDPTAGLLSELIE